jgi:predicted CXXCH cytochrome family protein
LLSVPATELCTSCHQRETPEFQARHGGYRAGKGDCTSCHDPHGSPGPGLTLAYRHQPYDAKECAACHTGTDGLKSEGAALCTTCHGNHAQDLVKPAPHAAVTGEDGCLSCHSPHAGRTKSLLATDTVGATCLTCHDRKLFEGSLKHPDMTECGTCHEPHGSETAGILVAPQAELCSTCHDPSQSHSHPFAGPAKDPRTGDELRCSSCHHPHSGELEQLLTHDKTRDLCVQCHLGPNLEVQGRAGR